MGAMGLHDHFRPPLEGRRHWHAFHNGWATAIAAALNERLPPDYFAEPNVQFGIEIDVATFEDAAAATGRDAGLVTAGNGASETFAPPAPTLTVPFPFLTDVAEVLVYGTQAGPVLAGAIELVSPANKDRASHREAFVSKCQAYLQQGVGLVIVDIVTNRSADLHQMLIARVAPGTESALVSDLYATAYRPVERSGQPALDVWESALGLSQPLPTMPLWLRGELCLPVELDATYERACREQRIANALR